MESVLAVSTRVCACTCAHTLLTQIKYKTQLLKTEQLAQNEIVVLPRAEWGEQELGGSHSPLPGLPEEAGWPHPQHLLSSAAEESSHS